MVIETSRRLSFCLFCSLLVHFLAIPLSNAQQIAPDVKSYTGKDYNGHPQIYCTLQDSNSGRVFLGTSLEVLIHNGRDFRHVTIGNGKAAFSMDMDRSGRVWLGCQSDLGYLKEDAKGRFRFVSLLDSVGPNKEEFLEKFNIIWDVHCADQKVFFNGIDHMMVLDREKDTLKFLAPWKDAYFSSKVGDRILYHELDCTLVALNTETLERTPLPFAQTFMDKKAVSFLPYPPFNTEKGLLIATRKNGIHLLQKDSLKNVQMPASLKKKLRSQKIYSASWGPHKTLCLGTDRGGIYLLRWKGEKVIEHRRIQRSHGIPSNAIWDLSTPSYPGGALWAGTENGAALSSPFYPIRTLREGKDLRGGVTDILDVPSQKGERKIVATTAGVQSLHCGEEVPISDYARMHQAKAEGLKGQCFDMAWLPNTETALVAKGNIRSFTPSNLEERSREFAKGNYSCLSVLSHPQRPGTDLIAAGGRSGIRIWGFEKNAKELLFSLQDLPEGVVSLKLLNTPEEKEYEHVIVASFQSQGVLVLLLNKEFLIIGQERLKTEGTLPDSEIRVYPDPFAEKPSKSVLLGTDKGAYRVIPDRVLSEGEGPEVAQPLKGTPISFSDTSKSVYCITPGKEEEVWFISDETVHHYHNGTLDSVPFKGLDIGTIRRIHRDEEGIVWFGADYGIARYNPRKKVNYDRPYPCLIEEVSIPLEEKDSLLERSFGGKGKRTSGNVTLPYRLNDITFSFIAPRERAQDAVRYSWCLEGYSSEFKEWESEAKASYTNLPEGDYRFRVKARNIHGKESRIAEYRFTVLPPWYRSSGAYVGYGVLSILLIWGVAKLNSRRVEIQKKHLEKVVEERTQEIRKRKEEIEVAHREITDSIDYAQRIQDALLQSEEYVSTHLPEHFILFKPQSRVSGDFYWARERNGYLYFAAVDCTGHGVPGAFMSMLGVAFLNEIMGNEQDLLPGEILERMRERVIKELSVHGSEEGAKDGMDAALLRIELNGKSGYHEVLFAGAQNPLYIIREGIAAADPLEAEILKDPSGSEQIKPFRDSDTGLEVKGDHRSVGFDESKDGRFKTIPLSLQKGDMLYIFSDGYADQFGGPKGKKFRYRPFKQNLVELHKRPLPEQKKELDRRFEEWKDHSDQEQVDDVLVIGIRL